MAAQGLGLYEYYAPGGNISSGLVAEGSDFVLNGRTLKILSGSVHYFRIHPQHWRDTLKKARAAGLNTVQTYVPWNLHEPRQGIYDFGSLGEDMSLFLDVRRFIEIAQEEDLFVIFRPGPYICSEWDFGGLPSWLLRDPTMHVRTFYEGYRSAAEGFLNALLPLVDDLQFTKGGPIMAVQIENEFGAFGWEDEPRDRLYLDFLKNTLDVNGFKDSLYFTSDSAVNTKDWGALPGVLMMTNFQKDAPKNIDALKELQPNRPVMVAEFWTGWFDHWGDDCHQTWSPQEYIQTLEEILQYNASVNLYMFIGGTNWGFMAGANMDSLSKYSPDATTYDYDAVLTEAGDYTEKYNLTQSLISLYDPLDGIVNKPAPPLEREKMAYGNFPVIETLDFNTLIDQISDTFNYGNGPVNMEALPINGGNGQSYGYIIYSTTAHLNSPTSTLMVRGHIRDMAQIMVDGKMATNSTSSTFDQNGFGFWGSRDLSLNLTGNDSDVQLDIMVENLGRNNYGKPHMFVQKKGLWEGPVLLDGLELKEWKITPLEFKKSFVQSLSGWQPFSGSLSFPAAYRITVDVSSTPSDTFLDMGAWGKGVVFVNGFNLGRYWAVGPTRTIYLPGPLLVQGSNEFIVFEQFDAGDVLTFIDYPILC